MTENQPRRSKSFFETIDLFLAVVVGKFLEDSLTKPFALYEIEVILAAVFIVILSFLGKYSRPMVKRVGKQSLRGIRWIVAIIAGAFFSGAYTIFTIYWPLGVIVIAIDFVFIAAVIHFIRLVAQPFQT